MVIFQCKITLLFVKITWFFPKGNHVWEQGSNFFEKQKKFLREQMKFFKKTTFIRNRRSSHRSNELSSNKGPSSPWKHMFRIFFATITTSCSYYICLWLSLKRIQRKLQLCSWKHFNYNSYEKVTITQNFHHICSQRNIVAPLSKLSLFSLKHMLGPEEFSMSFKKK